MQGQNGSHFEPKPVPPPIPKKCDWEIEPAELDFSNAAMIGKVCSLLKLSFVRNIDIFLVKHYLWSFKFDSMEFLQ